MQARDRALGFAIALSSAAGLWLGGVGRAETPPPAAGALAGVPWPMHEIDGRFRGANALSSGDVNGDGFPDYVTNYEFDQRYVVQLHPGADANPRIPWPTVVAFAPDPLDRGSGVNPEHAALGDFDGDGNLDVAGAQGWASYWARFWEGSEPGVRIVWGPAKEEVLDAAAWEDGGLVPGTEDAGHFHWIVAHDLNDDGATDLIAGGRVHGGNAARAGVRWLEAPKDPAERRDLSRWQVHAIDAGQTGGHGALPTDVDGDGDTDIVLANADFDTPEDEEVVLWYQNPGNGTPAQQLPWPTYVVYAGDEFDPKPGLAIGDLDGDGLEDLLTQTEEYVYWFRKTGIEPVRFERVAIRKHPAARFHARMIRVADLDGDGRQDILGALSHEGGVLPPDKASVFWMQWTGDEPTAEGWTTHVVKWGSGDTMLLPPFGEKWDQAHVADIDGDGDPDVVANLEEWWEERPYEFLPYYDPRVDPSSVAVVWFENRLGEDPLGGKEAEGVCVVEAERYTRAEDGTWVERGRYAGFSGDGYVQAHNALHPLYDGGLAHFARVFRMPSATLSSLPWSQTKGLTYELALGGGRYAVWLRRLAPDRWGYGLGGSRSDSVWLGIDGEALGPAGDDEKSDGHWSWVRVRKAIELAEGDHTLQLRVRERGIAVDRILLTTQPGFIPRGAGPEETPVSGGR